MHHGQHGHQYSTTVKPTLLFSCCRWPEIQAKLGLLGLVPAIKVRIVALNHQCVGIGSFPFTPRNRFQLKCESLQIWLYCPGCTINLHQFRMLSGRDRRLLEKAAPTLKKGINVEGSDVLKHLMRRQTLQKQQVQIIRVRL